MSINELSHITFIVKDLARAAVFFCDGLGAIERYDSLAKNYSLSREKFFILGNLWIVAMEGESLPSRNYQHVAFYVDAIELADYEQRLRKIGVEFKPSRARIESEGQSLYFYDFDNHLFELHSGSLDKRLMSYEK